MNEMSRGWVGWVGIVGAALAAAACSGGAGAGTNLLGSVDASLGFDVFHAPDATHPMTDGSILHVSDAPAAHCPAYKTCAEQGATCGLVGDGCGVLEECGTCPTDQSCGTGNKCVAACTPKTCAEQGFDCGMAGDGCGNVINCGAACPTSETCGATTANVCGTGACVPETCAQLGFNCGSQGDTCGNVINCGTCASGQSCGGGGTSGVCGAPTCQVQTCAQQGFNCGMATDGCGDIIDCGTCTGSDVCGASSANQCGGGAVCTGLCLQQQACAGGGTTSISGTVYAPNGTDPLYDALVYVPNSAVQPFSPGVSCDACGADASGDPLVQAVTGVDGTFTITNMPVGANIPLVIQLGRWRRQVVIPNVAACTNTAVSPTLTHMPQNRTQGDIPLMAFVTGSVDALECVFRKIGIQDTEFGDPGGANRLQLYAGAGGPGASYSASTPSETSLWGTQAAINQYDMVLFACQGDEYDQAAASQQIVINYANAGGRVFATHYSYVWLFNDAPFSTTAAWDADQAADFTDDPGTGIINTTFPKGLALAQWLQVVGASTTLGQIPIGTLRHDFDGVVAPSELWMTVNDPTEGNDIPMHYTFNTPVGAAPASQCGRVVYDDFHVEDQSLTVDPPFFPAPDFPAECAVGAMTAQEKLLEFMLFDLSACVTPDVPTCTPKTCSSLGATCGPVGDGCGNILQCGACPSGQVCVAGACTTACTPKTCASQGFQCGMQGDGCGDIINCGACPSGTCGGGGAGVCGNGTCTPKTCAELGFACGAVGDGCGNILNCGACPSGEACGANSMPGVCGKPPCTPKTCAGLGYDCGSASDGCGDILNCGTCASGQTCGGSGMANVCGGGSGA